jgi:hypothetical protein
MFTFLPNAPAASRIDMSGADGPHPTNSTAALIAMSCDFMVSRLSSCWRSFQPVLTVAAKCLHPDRIVHGLEQQPCGVQVVERVGLVGLNYSGFFRFNF